MHISRKSFPGSHMSTHMMSWVRLGSGEELNCTSKNKKVEWNEKGKDTEVSGEYAQSLLHTYIQMTFCKPV